MAYIPKEWKDLPSEETPIDAESLNHIEQGVGDLSTSVGDLSTLNTSNKNNLVEAINGIIDYSTEEIVVGTWKDGKKIYRKEVKATYAETQATFDLVSNVSTIVDVSGYCKGSGGSKQFIPMPNAFITLNTSNTVVLNATGMLSVEYDIFLEYTKTTD